LLWAGVLLSGIRHACPAGPTRPLEACTAGQIRRHTAVWLWWTLTIFKDAMTTAAAIDRLVHHSVVIELNVSSYRLETAQRASGKAGK